MSDSIIPNVVIGMPSQLFTMPRSFKAVANGKIYISKIDTPPGEMTDPANSVQVYLENEDGSHVPVSQPIIINSAGYPVYNGQISKFVTVQGHSMAVYDAYGAQQFYFPNILKYDPDQLQQRLAGTGANEGALLIGFNDPDIGPTTVDAALKLKITKNDLKNEDGKIFGYQYASDSVLRNVHDRISEVLSIMDYVEDDDDGDCSLALNRIFSKYSTAYSFQISFPSGIFSLKTAAIYNGESTVSLIGQQGTTLSLESGETSPNLSITSVRRIIIENLSIEAVEPDTVSTKIAVRLNCTGQDASHTIKSVRATTTINTSGKGVIMWDLYNVSLGAFSDVYTRYFGDYANVNFSNNIAWRMQATSKISTDSMFRNCSVVNGEIAWFVNIPVGGTGGAFLEGVTWIGCTVVECQDGLFISGDSSNPYRSPMFRWIGGHINGRRRCIYAYWVSQVYIGDGTHLYLTYTSTSSPYGLSAIFLEQVYETDIIGCNIKMVGQTDPSTHGVHIGPGCKLTNVVNLSYFSNIPSYAVTSFPGSEKTRAGNCTATYPGTALPSSISIGNSGDLNMGNNTVYAA